MSDPTVICYGLDDWEHLVPTPEEAVERIFADADYDPAGISWPIKVAEFKPRVIDTDNLADYALNCALESLDEGYLWEDADPAGPTPAMEAAAQAFARAVVEEYHVTTFETTGEVIGYTREQAFEIVGEETP